MCDAQTTVLYTLSTLAQTCAALAGLFGAIAIYRRQSLSVEAERLSRRLDDLEIQRSGDSPYAKLLFSNLRNPDSYPEAKRLYEYVTEELGPRRRRTGRLFVLFATSVFPVIFGSFVGFLFVDWLATNAAISGALLVLSVSLVLLFTTAMSLELMDTLAPILRCRGLRWLGTLLSKEGGTSDSSEPVTN